MLRRHMTVSIFVGLALSGPLQAVESSTSISQGSLTTHVYYLASDELGGRGTGSAGIDLAADYIAKEFKSYGLQPGGDDGSFFQTFELPLRKKITDQCALEFTGADVSLKLKKDFVPMPFSSSRKFEGPLVFAGYGVRNEDMKYDDYKDIDVKDKVVFMFRYEPESWAEEKGGRTGHATFRSKAFLAKDKGATAILLVNPPSDSEDKLYRFRTSARSGDYGLPMFHITRALADKLVAAGGLGDLESLYKRLEESDPHVYAPFKGISVTGNPGLEATKVAAKNVIGRLPGEGPLANEYVIFGAHYDHLGKVPPRMMPRVGEPVDKETAEIHNGADDNASGTAGIMELARVLAAGPKPKRTILFMTFTAEEMGLLGSAHYVDEPTVPLEDVVAMINLDMVGRLGDKPLNVIGTQTGKEFEDILNKHAKDMDLQLKMTGASMMAFGGSDHQSFYRKKIPVLFAFTGLHSDYHKPGDDSEKVDFDGQTRVLEYVRAVSNDIIESEARPTYQEVASPRRSFRQGMPTVRMGIMPSYAQEDTDQPGWAIEGVSPGGAADNAGIKDGDRIVKIADQEVSGIYDYMRILRNNKPGDEVQVVVQRGDKQITLTVKLEGR